MTLPPAGRRCRLPGNNLLRRSFMRFRSALFAGFGLPTLLLVIATATGQRPDTDPRIDAGKEQPGKGKAKDHIVEQSFPPNGLMETAWKVEWATQVGYGLIIKGAW